MAKQNQEETSGEQLDLIDITPENMQEIAPVAKKYRAAVRRRLKALDEEKKLKGEMLTLIDEANLSPLDDGTIKFRCDGLLIKVTPRDQLIQVKEEAEEAEEAA